MQLIAIVLVILYAAKIYLRDPQYRHIEICYMPYKVAHVVWVDAWGMLVTDDTASLLKHSRDLASFFKSCTESASSWPLLRTLGTNQ